MSQSGYFSKALFRLTPIQIIVLLAVVTLAMGLASTAFRTGGHRPNTGREARALERLKALGHTLQQYARDHGGRYPEGATSTEVFNQLIAEGYLSDVRLAMKDEDSKSLLGLVREEATEFEADPEKTRLSGLDVAWDVTGGAHLNQSPGLPLLYSTGFKVTYKGLIEPIPQDGQTLIYVYTTDGAARIFRIGEEKNWEYPFVPASISLPNSLRQLTPRNEQRILKEPASDGLSSE